MVARDLYPIMNERSLSRIFKIHIPEHMLKEADVLWLNRVAKVSEGNLKTGQSETQSLAITKQ